MFKVERRRAQRLRREKEAEVGLVGVRRGPGPWKVPCSVGDRGERRALVTVAVGDEMSWMFERTLASQARWCARWGVEHVVLGDADRAVGVHPCEMKGVVWHSLMSGVYDRVLYMDADVYVREGAGNVFDVVPAGRLGAYSEVELHGEGSDLWASWDDYVRRYNERMIAFGERPVFAEGWREYYNAGLWVADRWTCPHMPPVGGVMHIERETAYTDYWDQHYFNLMIFKHRIPVVALGREWNFFAGLCAARPDEFKRAHFVHYAGWDKKLFKGHMAALDGEEGWLVVLNRRHPRRKGQQAICDASMEQPGVIVRRLVDETETGMGVLAANAQLADVEVQEGKYVFVLDDDCRFVDGVVERLRAELERCGWPDVLVVRRRIGGGNKQPAERDWKARRIVEGSADTACVVVKAAVWEKAKGAWRTPNYEGDCAYVRAAVEAGARVEWWDEVVSETQLDGCGRHGLAEGERKRRVLFATVVSGDAFESLHRLTGPLQKAYARSFGWDYTVLRKPTRIDWPSPSWWKLELRDALEVGYEAVVYCDADAWPWPSAPSILGVVPEGKFGAFDSYVLPYMRARSGKTMKSWVDWCGVVGRMDAVDWPHERGFYCNAGIWVCWREARGVLECRMPVEVDTYFEQHQVNLNLYERPELFHGLGREWNTGHTLEDTCRDGVWFAHLNGCLDDRVRKAERIIRQWKERHGVPQGSVLV